MQVIQGLVTIWGPTLFLCFSFLFKIKVLFGTTYNNILDNFFPLSILANSK